LNEAFKRWLSPDPSLRPTARAFLSELGVLLEWDAQLARQRTARHLRRTVLRVAGGLSLAACVGGMAGYQWHKRTMGEANRATSRALQKADAAANELDRASSSLDKIIADPALGASEKARRITELVAALESRTAGLVAERARLEQEGKAAIEQARARAQEERAAADAALEKLQAERDSAERDKATAEAARWKAEAERDQAHNDQAAADSARVSAERERFKAKATVKIGDPLVEIVDHARLEHADLIVMGTHGRTGVSHLFLGSVAERAVRTAHCPVMTVR
jgi:nucleotide-binding universal stress UspA family protein